ncbi:MAG TPA: DMT family transporter [Gemmataceae bacterium]|nr:DMT family transporter [Gemmataceae bacterium]
MTTLSLLLILGSACLHVVQHVALKKARDRTAFVWWLWLWACVLFSPVLVLCRERVPASAWVILAVSAAFEALYYLAIARAYRSGDLSLVYPLARGTAPLLVFVWTALLLRERPSLGGLAGIALIAVGLAVINLPRPGAWRQCWRSLGQAAPRWALGAGLCISLYTTLDKVAVGLTDALLYTYLAMTMTLLWLTPATLREVGRAGLAREWRASRGTSALAGLSAMAAYAIVLTVMGRGAPASYVGAVREVSVVLGAAVGVLFLGEKGTLMRVLGSGLITSGVAAIATLG